jgi:hypothetical protein
MPDLKKLEELQIDGCGNCERRKMVMLRLRRRIKEYRNDSWQ